MEEKKAFEKCPKEPKITKKQALVFSVIGLIIYAICFAVSVTASPKKPFLFIFFGIGIGIVLRVTWKIYKSKETDWK